MSRCGGALSSIGIAASRRRAGSDRLVQLFDGDGWLKELVIGLDEFI